MPAHIRRITTHLSIYCGHITVGIVHNGDNALLIDFGNGDVMDALPAIGARHIDRVLVTHHHRDQACGLPAARAKIRAIGVPQAEYALFTDPASFWVDPAYRWHLYDFGPRHLLTEPVLVDFTINDGDMLAWGPATITALATPGHTDGSLSYLVEVDGQRILFCGDLLCGPGQLWDLYSLQKGSDGIRDYHAFLGARGAVFSSLERLAAMAPDLLIPSHGDVIEHPGDALALTRERVQACFDHYAATSALHWYFPQLFAEYAESPRVIPPKAEPSKPAWLRRERTTWTIISETGAAFVLDCGWESAIAQLRAWQANGDITEVEGLWITHYHDDHVDSVPEFQRAFGCPVIADESVAQVIAEPTAWNLPCLSPVVVEVDHCTRDGEEWQWREFTLTAYHFPGQSRHHGGLLVEGRGLRIFFTGDSFTPTGMDDYCPMNRNFLGAGAGHERCIALLERLHPDLLINAHVEVPFAFTAEEYQHMRENLAWREEAYAQLLPWDHPNFGLDPSWARCHPYEQTVTPGKTARLDVVVTNHADEAREVACRPTLPRAWGMTSEWSTATLPAKAEGRLPLSLPIPQDTPPGQYVIPIDIRLGDRLLPQFIEAIIMV